MPIPKWAKIAKFSNVIRRQPKRYLLINMAVSIIYIGIGVVGLFIPSAKFFTALASTPPTLVSRILITIFLIFSGGIILVWSGSLWRRLGIAPKGLETFHADDFYSQSYDDDDDRYKDKQDDDKSESKYEPHPIDGWLVKYGKHKDDD